MGSHRLCWPSFGYRCKYVREEISAGIKENGSLDFYSFFSFSKEWGDTSQNIYMYSTPYCILNWSSLVVSSVSSGKVVSWFYYSKYVILCLGIWEYMFAILTQCLYRRSEAIIIHQSITMFSMIFQVIILIILICTG